MAVDNTSAAIHMAALPRRRALSAATAMSKYHATGKYQRKRNDQYLHEITSAPW
jgi:hypothetical protein